MAKNDRIVRLDVDSIGLLLNEEKMLVIKDGETSMDVVPEEVYFLPPFEISHLSWETKLILNAVMISHGIESPFTLHHPH